MHFSPFPPPSHQFTSGPSCFIVSTKFNRDWKFDSWDSAPSLITVKTKKRLRFVGEEEIMAKKKAKASQPAAEDENEVSSTSSLPVLNS